MRYLPATTPRPSSDQAALLNHLSTDRRAQLAAYVGAASAVLQSAHQQARTTAAIRQLKESKRAQYESLKKLIAKNQAELNKLTAPAPSGNTPSSGGGGGGGGAGGGIVYHGPATGAAGNAVAFAVSQIGAPYVWGGTGPYSAGYDCSGLVMTAWAAAGVQIPRTTYAQWASLPHVATADIQPGDLLYYDADGHVAIYVGNNKIVDAPTPGENVEEIPMSTSWYAQNFDGAARP